MCCQLGGIIATNFGCDQAPRWAQGREPGQPVAEDQLLMVR